MCLRNNAHVLLGALHSVHCVDLQAAQQEQPRVAVSQPSSLLLRSLQLLAPLQCMHATNNGRHEHTLSIKAANCALTNCTSWCERSES